jgi:hypothetical protein
MSACKRLLIRYLNFTEFLQSSKTFVAAGPFDAGQEAQEMETRRVKATHLAELLFPTSHWGILEIQGLTLSAFLARVSF